MEEVELKPDECKRCNRKGKIHTVFKNHDTIYRCPCCNLMWGVDKEGKRYGKIITSEKKEEL